VEVGALVAVSREVEEEVVEGRRVSPLLDPSVGGGGCGTEEEEEEEEEEPAGTWILSPVHMSHPRTEHDK
jgi:hypothetical protein